MLTLIPDNTYLSQNVLEVLPPMPAQKLLQGIMVFGWGNLAATVWV